MVNDVSRAFFHSPVETKVCVQLAQEDTEPGDEHMCGRLNFSMYGTRGAAQNWSEEYSRHFSGVGFQQGKAPPCTFSSEGGGIRTYVHGDDSVSVGKPESFRWMQMELEETRKLKTRLLGRQKGHLKEVRIWNRIVASDEEHEYMLRGRPQARGNLARPDAIR